MSEKKCCVWVHYSLFDAAEEFLSSVCCWCGGIEYAVFTLDQVKFSASPCVNCNFPLREKTVKCSGQYMVCTGCKHSCDKCCSHPPQDIIITVTCEACGAICSEHIDALGNNKSGGKKSVTILKKPRDNNVCGGCGFTTHHPIDVEKKTSDASSTTMSFNDIVQDILTFMESPEWKEWVASQPDETSKTPAPPQ